MKPLQIEFGFGKWIIGIFHDHDGGKGLVIHPAPIPGKVGDYLPGSDEEDHMPQENELYLKFANVESAIVLKEMAEELIQRFSRCEVCGWPLAKTTAEGCVPGNCSQRSR